VSDRNTQTPSEFDGLDAELDPPQRCSTSLFTLLSGVAVDATLIKSGPLSRADDERGGTLRLWANRPGQNSTEAFVLAALSFWLISGIAVDLVTGMFGQASWSWPIALVAAPVIAFIGLHLFTLAIALCGTTLLKLGIAGKTPSDSLTSFLSLSGMTLIALIAGQSGHWLQIAAAGPWLLWAALNVLAWAVLLASNLFGSLSRLS